MSVNVNLKNPHAKFLLQSCEQVEAICKPLQQLNIAFFSYLRRFHDGSRSNLCTNSIIAEYFLKRIYQVKYADSLKLENNVFDKSYFSTLTVPGNPTLSEVRNSFDIDHVFVLLRQGENFTDYFFFRLIKIILMLMLHISLTLKFLNILSPTLWIKQPH